jgi:VWFA-related protein
MRAVLCSLLVFAAVSAQAQKPAIPSLGERVDVELTNVEVVVTDRDGTHVHGLARDDFEILEDGRAQPITHFAESAFAAKPDGDAIQREPRSLLLFIEVVPLPDFRVEPFIAALKDLVRTTITGPDDRAAVVSFDRRAVMRVAPTNDVKEIARVLDEVGQEFTGVRHNGTVAAAEQMNLFRQFEQEGAAMSAISMIDRPDAPTRTMTASASAVQVMQAESEMKRRVAAATAAVHALAGVEGRRILILATHRLGQLTGAEYVVATGGSGNAIDNRQKVAELIANANAAGVTVYPVYPSGLHDAGAGSEVGRSVLMNEMVSLKLIAERTGGATAYGAGDIAKLLPRVAGDVGNYYSLAYRATDDDSHEIVVRTKKPGLVVRVRRQVIERTDAGRMRDRLLSVLYEAWLYSPIRVTATPGEAKKAGTKDSVPLRVNIPIGQLTLLPSGSVHAGAFTVFLMTGAEYGETSGVVEETRRIEVPSDKLANYANGDVAYEVDLHVSPDSDRVAVGVLDEVSKEYGLTVVKLR